MEVDEFLECVSTKQPRNIRNLYELIDALYLICERLDLQNIKNWHVKKISRIRKSRNWKGVHSDYLENWLSHRPVAEKLLTLCDSDLISNSQNQKVLGVWGEGNSWVTCKQFFSSETRYGFELHQHKDPLYLLIRPQNYIHQMSIRDPAREDRYAMGAINKRKSEGPEDVHLGFELEDSDGSVISLLLWKYLTLFLDKCGRDIPNRDLWTYIPSAKIRVYAYVFED